MNLASDPGGLHQSGLAQLREVTRDDGHVDGAAAGHLAHGARLAAPAQLGEERDAVRIAQCPEEAGVEPSGQSLSLLAHLRHYTIMSRGVKLLVRPRYTAHMAHVRIRLRLAAPLLVAAAALTGCQRSLFTGETDRTQFDSYDRVRQRYVPIEEQDVFGHSRPALRARLTRTK